MPSSLEGDTEEGVGGVADEAGGSRGRGVRAGGCRQDRVGPGVDGGQGAGSVQVVGEALAAAADDVPAAVAARQRDRRDRASASTASVHSQSER